jgi:argininosuccinate lyase
MHSPKGSSLNTTFSQRNQTALQSQNPRVLSQLVQEQQDIIARLEVQVIRSRDNLIQAKNKHADINNQIIQANVSFQQALNQANRTIRTLRQEKDDLQLQVAEAIASSSTVRALNSALQVRHSLVFFQTSTRN